MSNITLTDRVASMLTEQGRNALPTIIASTCAVSFGDKPINQWCIKWETGVVSTSDHFEAGTDATGLPEIISVCVKATIPQHMILARESREHQPLYLHEGEVWSAEDLACGDLRTFQLLEWICGMTICQRMRERMRNEDPERFWKFATAPDPFLA